MAAQARDYFTRKALQGFGMASLAVTLVANFFNVVYEKIANNGPSEGTMAIVGIVLSVGMVLVFSEREEGLTKVQRGFIMALNAIVLFNANAGVNAFLFDKLGRDEQAGSVMLRAEESAEAGFLDALKGILVPRTPWFSQDLPELNAVRSDLQRTKEEIASLAVLDTIHTRIDTMVVAQERNLAAIAARDSELVVVRAQYQRTLSESMAQATAYQERLRVLERAVRENPGMAMEGIAELRNTVAARSDSSAAVQQQVQQEIEEQGVQQDRQRQQVQHQQQQQRELQQQVQQQQQQLFEVRKRLFR